jgi:Tfp pilus assembly protein PilP
MAKTLKILLLAAFIPIFLVSCGSEPEKEWKPKRAKAPAQAAPAQPAPEEPVAEVAKEPGKPKRNPFLSFIVLLGDTGKPQKVRGPLECCELNLFRVVAVVKGEEAGYALIHAPDNKRYIVRRGDVMGLKEGKIIRIDPRSITIREHTRNSEGKIISTSDEEIGLPEDKHEKLLR